MAIEIDIDYNAGGRPGGLSSVTGVYSSRAALAASWVPVVRGGGRSAVQRGRLLLPSWRALWALLVPWCLPSSVRVVLGWAVWWSAVLLSMLCRQGGCWALLLIVGALAGLCAVVLPWSSVAGAACVLCLLLWIAAGMASRPAWGPVPVRVSSPTA